MNKYNGPLVNNTKRAFTTRDSLGIEGIANTISADLCPIVNTVTPRPYYWAFITWCYWKYYKLYGTIKDTEVRRFISQQNFFIALGNILAGNTENVTGGFTGVTNITSRIDSQAGEFTYDSSYIVGIGAMGYYPPGLQTMNLVTRQEIKDGFIVQTYNEPHITHPDGTRLAEAFDNVISKTQYYQHYLTAVVVSRNVLLELGKTIRIDLSEMDECKEILKEFLFRTDRLAKCRDYISFIINNKYADSLSVAKCRTVFFDEFSPKGRNNSIDEGLLETARGWEVLTGRQYFTLGLEIIWKYMIDKLIEPMTKEAWISYCISLQEFSFNIDDSLSTILDSFNYDSSSIEQILSKERPSVNKHSFENGLSIILSVYNRFSNREDYSHEQLKYYDYGTGGSVSFNEAFKLIDDYRDKPVIELLEYIMMKYLINQHLETAFGKMLENRDGYYIQEINGKYIASHEFWWDYQGNRMVQLYSGMVDLGIL